MGNDIFYSNFFFFNIIIIFREQFALLEFYEWQRRLGEEKKNLTNSSCVCLGLIMVPVDDIQHSTGALISGMSHSFFFFLCHSVCIHCYWAHDWSSLMAICHANDGVPNRFGVNAPPLTSEQEGSRRSAGN